MKATGEDVTISISGMPKELLEKLDKLAGKEHRPRSRQIVKLLEDAIKERDVERQHSRAA